MCFSLSVSKWSVQTSWLPDQLDWFEHANRDLSKVWKLEFKPIFRPWIRFGKGDLNCKKQTFKKKKVLFGVEIKVAAICRVASHCRSRCGVTNRNFSIENTQCDYSVIIVLWSQRCGQLCVCCTQCVCYPANWHYLCPPTIPAERRCAPKLRLEFLLYNFGHIQAGEAFACFNVESTEST